MDQETFRKNVQGGIIGQAKAFGIEKLTARERWRRTFNYQAVDRIPHYEFGYWAELYDEWHAQGLPAEIENERQANDYFGFDKRWGVPARMDIYPRWRPRIIHEDERHILKRDGDGVIGEINKDGSSSIPHYIEFPIKTRDDWKRFKERLNPDTPGRLPEDIEKYARRSRQSHVPVGINVGSLFGRLRNWMGFEHIALMVYDDMELIDDMVETMCNLVVKTIEPILKVCEIDYAGGWEDMAFNNGPMISPKMFRELLVPRYKRIADLCNRHGVNVIWTDCDGNIMPIAGLWLEAGYNCMFPIEVRARTDPVALREKYGRDVLLLGGYDKMALLAGEEEILAELKRIAPYVEQGGFIPHVDHRVPAGVPLVNYRYYLREKKAMLGFSKDEL